jgi:hypothetical protein
VGGEAGGCALRVSWGREIAASRLVRVPRRATRFRRVSFDNGVPVATDPGETTLAPPGVSTLRVPAAPMALEATVMCSDGA